MLPRPSDGPRPEDVAIIRELYQGSQDQERFEVELERALDARCHTIVIEPARLGDETARFVDRGITAPSGGGD